MYNTSNQKPLILSGYGLPLTAILFIGLYFLTGPTASDQNYNPPQPVFPFTVDFEPTIHLIEECRVYQQKEIPQGLLVALYQERGRLQKYVDRSYLEQFKAQISSRARRSLDHHLWCIKQLIEKAND